MPHEKVECVWNTGSSCHTTGKSIQPTFCQKKKCPGIFNNYKDMMEFCDHAQAKHKRQEDAFESVKKFVNRYDPGRHIEVKP
jgi:hypothetical protein